MISFSVHYGKFGDPLYTMKQEKSINFKSADLVDVNSAAAKDAAFLPLVSIMDKSTQNRVEEVSQITKHFKISLKNFRKGTESQVIPCN